MTDELAPFFESRELRVNRLPDGARDSFSLAATAARDAGQTDFEDRQFVSLWLSRRTGMPRTDILNNFDAIAGRFFGEGATATKAWDTIAATYKQAGAAQGESQGGGENARPGQLGGQQDQEFADTEGLAKVGRGVFLENTEQSARTVGAGFTGFAQQVPAGLYSQAATVLASPGRPKSPFEDRTYLDLAREKAQILRPPFWPYDHDKEPSPAEAKRLAKIDADMATLAARTDEQNRARLKEFSTSTSKDVSDEYRRLAGFWYDLSKGASERMGVNPEFEKTTMGSFMKSAGSVPATAAMAVMGPAGWLGMEGSFFAQVEQERMDIEGKNYDPQKAAAANLASAIPQAVMERAFGVERLMNKVLGESAKQGGKVLFGDFARNFVKEGLTAGVEEAITEPTQNFWNDYVASLTYDQKRELFTADAAKQRLVESVSAFALGFLFGGGVKSLEGVDHNRKVAAGERYLTTREGQTLEAHDFRVMREVKSDQELMATAPDEETGKVLVAAVNGDQAAQAAYNNRVMQSLFVKTDDVDVAGMSVGHVNEVPVVRMADGVIVPLDLTKEEDRTFLDNFKREAVKVKATQDTMAELQKRHGDTLEASNPPQLATLEQRVASGQMTQEQANDALEVAKTINGLAADLKLSDVAPEGSATTRQDGDVWKMVVEVAQSADPTKAVEEVAESYIHRAYKTQNLVPADLNAARLRWHQQNGEADAAVGFDGEKLDRANIEWFSKRVVEYAVANRKTELPGGWGAWLRTLGEQLKKFLGGAIRMKKLMRDGKLDPELEAWMKGAIGKPGDAFGITSENAAARAEQGNAEAAPVASEVDQEMMEQALADQSFPKIERNEAGGDFLVSAPGGRFLGSRPTIEEAQQMAVEWFDKNARAEEQAAAKQDAGETKANELMTVVLKHGLPAPSVEPVFGGELRALRENLGTAKALRIFRKNAGDLDMVRQAVNEEGFNFETVTDFLDALDRSSRGESIYGNKGGDEQVTFALGDGAEITKRPVTFSLAYHGTPHRIRGKLSTDRIGTGEGVQAYGWGLYFAEEPDVAVSYVPRDHKQEEKIMTAYKKAEAREDYETLELWEAAMLHQTPDQIRKNFGDTMPKAKVEKVAKALERILAASGGALYTVDIIPERSEFLNWDTKLEDQSEPVKKALRELSPKFFDAVSEYQAGGRASEIGMKYGFNSLDVMIQTAAGAYSQLARQLGSPKAASLALLKKGVPGIVYLDQNSRDEGKGTSNFVLFDGSLAKIIAENGTPVPSVDETFALTGVPQNSTQALQAQASALRAKKLAATAGLVARLRSGTPLPARAALVRRSTQASLAARLAMPISSRLARIERSLAQRLRRFEFDLGNALTRDFAQVEGFIRGFEKMRPDDAAVLDLALKNGDTDTRDTLLTAYNLTAEFQRVLGVLEATKAKARAAGYEFGDVADYFPRKVNDVDGLFMHYYGKPQAGRIEEVLREAQAKAAAQGRTLTHEERVEIVNSVLRGFRPSESKPSNLKARKTDVVDVDADRFYADSIQALVSYVESLNSAIEQRRFFGKFSVTMQSATGGVYSSNRIAVEASVGALVEDMIAAGKITRAQQAEVSAILEARFNQQASSPFIRAFKALSYMGTMGQITSAMTQLTDLAFSLYENGVYDTAVAGAQAITRTSKISRKDLSLDTMAEEFRDMGKLHKALNRVFKLVGIHYLDMVGKETLVNAKFRVLQREAAAGKLSAKSRELITASFGQTLAPRVIGELARGLKTEDTMFATYSILADYQPVSMSEMPEFYLRHPNGRVFYMLKTFALKQIDAFRREAFTLIVHGNAKQKATGFKNLIHMAAVLYMIGLPVDWLKDWVMGRDPQMGDLAVDNIFKLLGVNRWNIWQFRERKNPLEAAMMLIVPPAPFLQYPLLDAEKVAKKIEAGDDIEPGNFETWRMLPFVGAPIYWWFGGGAKSVEERKRKRERGRVNP